MNTRKIHKKEYTVGSLLIMAILVVYVASLIVPMFWALLTSLKGILDYIENPLGFPKVFEFNNYFTAYQYFFVAIDKGGETTYVYIEEMLFNSLLYAVGASFFGTLATTMVAYVTARFNYRFSKIIYWVVVITMILPIVGSLPSEIQVTKALGIYDSIIGMYILKANFLGLYFLVFHAMFKTIPQDYVDAAVMDGAGNFRVFTQIMLPIAKKLFGTVMLIRFIEYWNDYQSPMIYLPTRPTLAVGLFNYSASTINAISSTPLKLAGALMIFVPIFVLFIFMQKQLIGGMSMGGVKE